MWTCVQYDGWPHTLRLQTLKLRAAVRPRGETVVVLRQNGAGTDTHMQPHTPRCSHANTQTYTANTGATRPYTQVHGHAQARVARQRRHQTSMDSESSKSATPLPPFLVAIILRWYPACKSLWREYERVSRCMSTSVNKFEYASGSVWLALMLVDANPF